MGHPLAVTRATKTDRPQREPARDWHPNTGSHGSVIDPLDALRHQRSSGAAKAAKAKAEHRRSLDPHGCLARFVAATI